MVAQSNMSYSPAAHCVVAPGDDPVGVGVGAGVSAAPEPGFDIAEGSIALCFCPAPQPKRTRDKKRGINNDFKRAPNFGGLVAEGGSQASGELDAAESASWLSFAASALSSVGSGWNCGLYDQTETIAITLTACVRGSAAPHGLDKFNSSCAHPTSPEANEPFVCAALSRNSRHVRGSGCKLEAV